MPLSTHPHRPTSSDFTPVTTHQESTPASFYDGPPVLYKRLGGCRVLVSREDLGSGEVLRDWWGRRGEAREGENGVEDGAEGGASGKGERVVKEGVEVWVSTESLTLCTPPSTSASSAPTAQHTTLKIPYPAISLHATQRLYYSPPSAYTSDPPPPRPAASDLNTTHESTTNSPASQQQEQRQTQLSAIYLQLDPHHGSRAQTNPNGDDDGGDGDEAGGLGGSVALLVVPPPFHSASVPASDAVESVNGDGVASDDELPGSESRTVSKTGAMQTPNQTAAEELFEALSACADLWPDESADDEGEEGGAGAGAGMAMLGGGGGGSGMPGEGGWITAENAHEFEGVFGHESGDGGDEDGQGVVVLGPGAGTRRARGENGEVDGGSGVAVGDGSGGDVDETNAGEEETKWQRTS